MPVKTADATMPASYFRLVREFPLVKIRDDAHCDRATAMIDRLMRMDLDEGQESYLDVLADLVVAYEDSILSWPRPSQSSLLGMLMESSRLTQAKLAEEVGIPQSTISSVLNGKRSLTQDNMTRLGRRFNLPASVFLPE
jgi:HTH-type transcriptional regulator/antitoxin HigA